jgi:hypothetical protein
MTTDAFLATLCLTGFVVIFYGPWQEACTDFARQIVFEQRDKLFDMARAGKMDFTSKEYRTIRANLENMIRFAHELTMPRLIYMSKTIRYRRDDRDDVNIAINNIRNEEVKGELVEIIVRVYVVLVTMMVFKSLICVVCLPFLFVAYLGSRAFSKVSEIAKKYVMKTGELIQAEAACA